MFQSVNLTGIGNLAIVSHLVVLGFTLVWNPAIADDANSKLMAARDYIAKSEFKRAEDLASDVISDDEIQEANFVEALRIRGSARLRGNDIGGSIGDFSSLLRLRPKDIWALWQRCWANTRKGRLSVARRDCETAARLIRQNPGIDKDGLSKRAVISAYAQLMHVYGRPEKSAELLHSLLRDGKNNSSIDWTLFVQVAEVESTLGKYEEAIEYFNRALKIAPTNAIPRIYNKRGEARFDQGKFDEAWNDFRVAYMKDPNNVNYSYNICAADLRSKQFTRAISSCVEPYLKNPNNIIYIDSYGVALINNQRYQKAVEVFEEGLALDPGNPYIINNLYDALHGNREYSRAEKMWQPN